MSGDLRAEAALSERRQIFATGPVLPVDIRRVVRRVLLAAAFVSGGINLLLLVPALYMYQVYDRVLATQHVETLVALTVIAVLALALLAALDAARSGRRSAPGSSAPLRGRCSTPPSTAPT